jgi:hypothetical protein
MKARRCSADIAPIILNLGASRKWVANVTLRPLYLQERNPVPFEEAAGAPEPVWNFGD